MSQRPGEDRRLAYLIDSSFVTITLSELLVGIHRANDSARRARREESLHRWVALVRVLPFDEEVARRHAAIAAELTAKGETWRP